MFVFMAVINNAESIGSWNSSDERDSRSLPLPHWYSACPYMFGSRAVRLCIILMRFMHRSTISNMPKPRGIRLWTYWQRAGVHLRTSSFFGLLALIMLLAREEPFQLRCIREISGPNGNWRRYKNSQKHESSQAVLIVDQRLMQSGVFTMMGRVHLWFSVYLERSWTWAHKRVIFIWHAK